MRLSLKKKIEAWNPCLIKTKNINLITQFITAIIVIENKLSPCTRFTPAQTAKFKQVKEASGYAVEFKVKFDKEIIIDGRLISLNSNTSFNIEQSEVIKLNDYGTNDVGTIALSDVEFIKDSSKS